MFGDEARKYLAAYLIDAFKRADNLDAKLNVQRDSVCESPDVTIEFKHKSYNFMFGRTPFNSDAARQLIDDKLEVYNALRGRFPVPYTEAIEKSSDRTSDDIRSDILTKINNDHHYFQFPIVIKPNMGSLAHHVFIAEDSESVLNALEQIRSDSRHGDQILIQQFMGDEDGAYREMRAICLDGESQIIFERDTEHAIPNDIANPDRWPGVKFKHIVDPQIITQVDQIAKYLYEKKDVSYVAFDLKCDREGKIWVLEGNSSPMGLSRLERELSNGRDLISKLTDQMIAKMSDQEALESYTQEKEAAQETREPLYNTLTS